MAQNDSKEDSKPAIDRNAPVTGKPGEPNTTKGALIEKAQAMVSGEDPQIVEIVDELEGTKKMVKVEKDGETLKVHPTTLQDHINAGWKLA